MTNDQLKRIIKMASKSNGHMVEAFVESAGGEDNVLNLMNEFPWESSFAHNFKAGEKFLESEFGNLMEDNGGISATATAVFSLLGVTSAVVNAYELPQNFMGEKCMYVEPSKTFQEPKAWLYRPDLPDQIDDMEEPSESGFYPRSLVVTNSDFAKAWKISRRAIDDDQVGQFARVPGQIGEGHRNQEEIYFAGFLYGSNFSTNGISVPVPTYTDPDGTLGVYVTSGNRQNALATPAALTQNSIQDLITLSKAIKDPGGKTLLIKPSILWGGTGVSFQAAAILNSTFWPSAMSGAATPTVTGTFSTVNPLDPKWGALRAPLDYLEQPYFNGTNDLGASTSSKLLWGMMEPKKNGIIMQNRQPLEVLMEAPNAGGSIRTRSYYYRTYRRFADYYGDARFLFLGSDGTV